MTRRWNSPFHSSHLLLEQQETGYLLIVLDLLDFSPGLDDKRHGGFDTDRSSEQKRATWVLICDVKSLKSKKLWRKRAFRVVLLVVTTNNSHWEMLHWYNRVLINNSI